MKILKYILLVIVLMGTEQITLSQYYLKVKSDSISLKSDSVFIYLDKCRGAINWQASSDLKNWVSLNKHKDTLGIRIDSSAYYRATIVEGDCKPVMSDTAFLIEKLTVTGSTQFTVDSLGGVFLLPSGIKVKIPKGAVTTPKEIKVDLFGYDNANTLGAINISENTAFLTGFSITTDLFHFSKPIKIKIPIQNTDVKNLPVLYELNRASSTWLLSEKTIIVSTKDKFVEIILTGSDQKTTIKGTKSGTSTQGTKSELDLNDIRSFFLNLYGDIFLSEDPCRKIGYNVIMRELDKTESGGCTVTTAHEEIEYWGCDPTQKGTNVALALSPQCEPKLHISPESLKIVKGKSGSIMLKTDIGDYPLSDQVINLSTSGPISASSTELKTDSYGNASFGVTGIDIGQGVIHLAVAFDYYLNTIYASGNAGMEYHEYDHKQITKYYTINVTVIDVPEVTTASVTGIKCTSAAAGGNVLDDNNSDVTARGILINGIIISAGSGTGSFTTSLAGLECNTPYSVTAYATNEAGTGYGNPVTFTTLKLEECIVVTSTAKDSTCTIGKVRTTVISECSEQVIDRGIYYGTSPNPEITGTKYQSGIRAGSFTITLSNLLSFTTYYATGYATTVKGTVYGNKVSFSTGDTLTDIDGNVYKTVTIGTQVWMAENLKTTKYSNGDLIGTTISANILHEIEPKYQWPCHGDESIVALYGRLYTWYAVADIRNVCPTGWHIPSDAELTTLENYMIASGYNYDGTLSGSKIAKALASTSGWISSTITGAVGNTDYPAKRNATCFTALPGGHRYEDSYFYEFGTYSYLWSSTEVHANSYGAWARGITSGSISIIRGVPTKNNGYSVRCLKDN